MSTANSSARVYLEKNQAKGEQYSRRNNVEISGIPNSIPDKDLENTVSIVETLEWRQIRRISRAVRLPLSRYSRGQDKKVIVKFVNRKYSEALLKDKKRICSKRFNHLNVPNKVFVSVSLCPYYIYVYGVSARIYKGKAS